MSTISYEKSDKIYEIKSFKFNRKNLNRIALIASIALCLLLGLILYGSSTTKNHQTIDYNEKGNVGYTVYLKENELSKKFYEKNYLDKDIESIVADLINTINVKFKYELHSTKELDFDYNYSIIGTLNIYNAMDSKKLSSKDYVLLENVKMKSVDNSFEINEDVNINYDLFNQYAMDFKNSLAVAADAVLDVKMQVDVEGNYSKEDKKVIDSFNNFQLSIPLTERTIDIKINSKNLDNSNVFDLDESNVSTNVIIFGVLVLCALGCAVLYFSYKMYSDGKDPYQSALDKILRENDTHIVNASSSYRELDDVVRVKTFEELLDARKIENSPIIFYDVEPGNKAYFIVVGKKVTYRFTLTRAYQMKQEIELLSDFDDNISESDEDVI